MSQFIALTQLVFGIIYAKVLLYIIEYELLNSNEVMVSIISFMIN